VRCIRAVANRTWCLLLLQLQHSPIKWFIFQACVWVKSFWMKRGIKHDKVSRPLVLHKTHLQSGSKTLPAVTQENHMHVVLSLYL
jgi:hypothetical protein